MKYDSYLPEQYVVPFWLGNTIINESVLPLEDSSGTVLPISLLYRADEIIELRNSRLDKLYTLGKDYTLADGKLVILPEGEIKSMKYDEFFFDKEIPGKCFAAQESGYIFFAEGSEMHDRQLAVTYNHSDHWQGEFLKNKAYLLPRTVEKLNSGEEINVLAFGDSISTGANSSGIVGAPPFAEDWCAMAVRGLGKYYNNPNIKLVNKAVGGTASAWGAENARTAAECAPLLAMIGFGMNDGSARVPADEFGKNISDIMSSVSEISPNCEFILISTTLAHPAVRGFYGIQEDYLPVLNKMERQGVCVADMTTFHKQLLSSKRFFDMTGNNVNHPNDFLARAYAQCILATLGAI